MDFSKRCLLRLAEDPYPVIIKHLFGALNDTNRYPKNFRFSVIWQRISCVNAETNVNHLM